MDQDNNTIVSEEASFLETIDVYTLVKDFFKNIWVIVLAGISAALIVSAIPIFGHTPMYTASSTLLVTGTINSSDGFTAYSKASSTLAGILVDPYVKSLAAKDLGLDNLNGIEIKSEVIAKSNVISLTARSSKATLSYGAINAILNHYQDVSKRILGGYILQELIPPAYPNTSDNPLDLSVLMRRAVLFAMLGAAALILVLSYYYDSVKNERDASKLTVKLYASIYHEKKAKTLSSRIKGIFGKGTKQTVLIDNPNASFGYVETYKRLREKIVNHCTSSSKAHGTKRNVILLTSMMENEGKSTVAANLAIGLSAVSDKVCLIDADLRKPAQYKILGLESGKSKAKDQQKKHPGLGDYLNGRADYQDCFVQDKHGIHVIYDTKSYGNSSDFIAGLNMETLIEDMRQQMDYVIVDTPPVTMVADAEMLANFTDYTLPVIRPDNAPTIAVNDFLDTLQLCRSTVLGAVLNNISTLPLMIRQMTGINLYGGTNRQYSDYSHYSSYGYSYGYDKGYGYSKGYGYRKTGGYGYSGNSRRSSRKAGKLRTTDAGDDFFTKDNLKNSFADKED